MLTATDLRTSKTAKVLETFQQTAYGIFLCANL